MDIRKTDLNLLPVFDALLKTRSVTRAGQQLGLSQPAMSYSLARLREQFGDPLFVRSGRQMLPTPLAQEIALPIGEVLDTSRRRIFSGGGFDPLSAQREFCLCLADIGGLVFLPRLRGRLRELAPRCTLRTVQAATDELEGALESGDIDLAIGFYPDLPGSLLRQRLYDREYVCVFWEEHPGIGRRLTIRQYVELEHAVIRTPVRVHNSCTRSSATGTPIFRRCPWRALAIWNWRSATPA